ncbi:MAG: hypothetical protein K0S09_27 [Sphingobacteriaceae bacterium]|jgi:hypothetical protein|nr:hypothetical protein [Sphingobacteriaceae bacterium]
MPLSIEICKEFYVIPTFGELTIKHLIDLRRLDQSNPLAVLRWGLDREPQLTSKPRTDREVGNALTLISELIKEVYEWMASDERVRVPKDIDVMGLVIPLNPGLLQRLPYWGTVRCKEAMQAVISTTKEGEYDFTDKIPEIIAHYLYSEVTRSKYNEDKADELISIVEKLPMTTCIQLGNFFLLKQTQLFLSNKSYWLTKLTLMKKRLALKFSRSTGI